MHTCFVRAQINQVRCRNYLNTKTRTLTYTHTHTHAPMNKWAADIRIWQVQTAYRGRRLQHKRLSTHDSLWEQPFALTSQAAWCFAVFASLRARSLASHASRSAAAAASYCCRSERCSSCSLFRVSSQSCALRAAYCCSRSSRFSRMTCRRCTHVCMLVCLKAWDNSCVCAFCLHACMWVLY